MKLGSLVFDEGLERLVTASHYHNHDCCSAREMACPTELLAGALVTCILAVFFLFGDGLAYGPLLGLAWDHDIRICFPCPVIESAHHSGSSQPSCVADRIQAAWLWGVQGS
jgi:hypothetical protein